MLWGGKVEGMTFSLVLMPKRALQCSHIEMRRLISHPGEDDIWDVEWKR